MILFISLFLKQFLSCCRILAETNSLQSYLCYIYIHQLYHQIQSSFLLLLCLGFGFFKSRLRRHTVQSCESVLLEPTKLLQQDNLQHDATWCQYFSLVIPNMMDSYHPKKDRSWNSGFMPAVARRSAGRTSRRQHTSGGTKQGTIRENHK